MSIDRRVLIGAAAVAVVIGGASVHSAGQAGGTSALHGTWQVVEVTMTAPQPQTVKPQPNLTIFCGNHYSRTEIHANEPRPALQDPAKATADELRAVWGPFVAEAGTFEVSGDQLTLRPSVAKNPAAMKAGTFSVLSFKLDGTVLVATAQRNQDGPVRNPFTIRAVRVE
jgi:hypothetical protein